MKITLALPALLLAALTPVRAQPPQASCQTFTRASAGAPPQVRAWLAHSPDDHVIACGQTEAGGAPEAGAVYSGESAVTHQGEVCSYSSHGLRKVGAGAASQLQRYERGDAVQMALARQDCPPPHSPAAADHYIETYDVSPAAFVAIMELWSTAAASAPAFDRGITGARADAAAPSRTRSAASAPAAAANTPAPATRARLHAAIDAGRMKTAPVIRIVRMSGIVRRRYALFIADPDSRPPGSTLYVIYLSRPLGGTWHITGIADAVN